MDAGSQRGTLGVPVELAILPFFIPLILIGRFVDAWREYRGTGIDGARTIENDWAETWGKLLSTSEPPALPPESQP